MATHNLQNNNFYTFNFCWDGTITTLEPTLKAELEMMSDGKYSDGKIVKVKAIRCNKNNDFCYHREITMQPYATMDVESKQHG